MVYTKVVKRVDPKRSHHKEIFFVPIFLLLLFFYYICMRRWMLAKPSIHPCCGHHFTIYVKSNHHAIHLKLIQVMYINYFSIKVEK